jgi:magnesium chelatase subunit D
MADQPGVRESDGDLGAAIALFCVDPAGTGVCLRAMPGPARDWFLTSLRDCLPQGGPVRRVPLHVSDDRLLGGLDLTATLSAGRPVVEQGILVAADGGVVELAMAERLSAGTAARVASVMDAGAVAVERDGVRVAASTAFGLVMLDEGIEPEEGPPAALVDRVAFHIGLEGVRVADLAPPPVTRDDVALARGTLAAVSCPAECLEALCAAAAALGIGSVRAPLLALRVARAAAALDGRSAVGQDDVLLAVRLVYPSRATMLPAADSAPTQDQPPPSTPEEEAADQRPPSPDSRALDDLAVAAAAAAIPPDLLARMRLAGGVLRRPGAGGRAGARRSGGERGRAEGARPGTPRRGARLDVMETLRAAAPWQRLRRQSLARPQRRVEVRREDMRVRRIRQNATTTTVFVVDASGSAALHRLAEAKGAVELLLAECYVRRDRVALVAFRGHTAELLLPPTRSLVRAKRSLARLRGGGGTPLAGAIDHAAALAGSLQRQGDSVLVVFLTDGRANVARDGSPGREAAEAQALEAARHLAQLQAAALLVDTSPRPQAQARALAAAMAATYLPLPHADAPALTGLVRTAAAPPSAGRRAA